VAEDYTKWFFSRLRSVELALSDGRQNFSVLIALLWQISQWALHCILPSF